MAEAGDHPIDPGASYVVMVDVADSLSAVGVGAGIALALLAPLTLVGPLRRRRRLATLLLAGSLALVLAACSSPPPPMTVGFSVQLTAIDASSGSFVVAENGLPVDGAEVTVTY